MAEEEEVNVSVADDHLDRFDDVVRRMEQAGLKVQQQLQALGVVSGSIDSAKMSSLEKVAGVAGVERSRQVQIPPPESDVQ
jgi:hypothetical protein